MMKIDTLVKYRWLVRKFDYHPSLEFERTLIDSHIEALSRIEELELKLGQI